MKNSPIKIALTGGIGSGKSTIAKVLALYQLPVYDSDAMAKQMMKSDKQMIDDIVQLFGEEAYIHGELNRSYIAENVFGSVDKLKKLNRIVHSAVINHFFCWAEKQNTKAVVFESAIIFENNLEKYFDFTIAVVASKRLRVERVRRRSGLTIKAIENRIANQLSNRELETKADFVVANDDKRAVIPQVEQILCKLKIIN